MGNPKDKDHSDSGTIEEGAESVHNACQAAWDLSHERDAALSRQIGKAVTRETAKVTAHFQALLNERTALNLAGSLKVTSRAAGFKVMDLFDWTKDKAIYQRWQMWSEKARHTLEAMEGDSEKTKISYFHHWVDSEGMAQIESWKNNKTLLKQDYDKLEETQREGKYFLDRIQSYFTLFESMLAPKSNPLLSVEELCFAKQGSMNSGEFHAHVVKIVKRCKFPCAKGRRKGHQGHHFPRHEQYKGQGQSHQFDERGGKRAYSGLSNATVRNRRLQHSSQESIPAGFQHFCQRTAKGTEEMERTGDRINLESKDLLILDISLENPQGWRASA